ncbi:MAG: flagellar biosynthetic protein FliO [Fidelibacterota bacterium]|nr:MAG: flagellar biosynthetic protein FliO [Candidatus Neomarinimicrobiota bacterium]
MTLTLWKVIVYVALIIAVIVIGARILKRYGGDRLKQASSPDIRVLGRRYISPKQSIVMVKVRHKELLLGITDHSIRLLYDFTPEENQGDGTEFA